MWRSENTYEMYEVEWVVEQGCEGDIADDYIEDLEKVLVPGA